MLKKGKAEDEVELLTGVEGVEEEEEEEAAAVPVLIKLQLNVIGVTDWAIFSMSAPLGTKKSTMPSLTRRMRCC